MLNKVTRFINRNSTTILTVLASAGVVTTVVLAVRATPKALALLEDAKGQKEDDLTTAEIVQTTWKCYIPTAVSGALTLGCMASANVLSVKQTQSLASAYAMLANYHSQYRNKLIELEGEEIDNTIKESVARNYPDFHQLNLDIPDQKCLWIDEDTGEIIERYEREIMDAEYHINRNYVLRGCVTLNELREFLGFAQTLAGEDECWCMESGFMWIDFYHVPIDTSKDGRTIYAIRATYGPDAYENYE